jgi:DNA (cytosine-5)-methyltransferase 1
VVRAGGTIITLELRDAKPLQGCVPLQGFTLGWIDLNSVLTEFRPRKFNKRRRWLLIGNGANVEVLRWIAPCLATAARYDGAAGTPIPLGGRWHIAACFGGKTRWAWDIDTRPVQRDLHPLAFLIHGGAFLSRRATEGFYSRLIKSQLRVKPEFKATVADRLDRMQGLEKRSRAMPIAAESWLG